MTDKMDSKPFHPVKEDIKIIEEQRARHLDDETAYKLAFTDQDFLLRDELRPVRLQLELLRPELALRDQGINETVVFFGSARMLPRAQTKKNLEEAHAALEKDPNNKNLQLQLTIATNKYENSKFVEEARKLACQVATCAKPKRFVVTGGGPGFMAAANKGASEAGERSIALNMILPNEQVPNPYVTKELTFQFHYFAIRKMHFLMRAKAMIAFPGGFGTLDELFETLTLLQTKKMEPIPILLFNEKFWKKIINFDELVEEGTISREDLQWFQYVETAEQAWEILNK